MTRYIKYSLILREPVRIADDSSAKQGQTDTLRYIPGSSIRGHVINAILTDPHNTSEPHFNELKKELFSDRVRFLNAYLTISSEKDGCQVLIPSPKGFYENKEKTEGKKKIENVVLEGKYHAENKRAKLGNYAMFEQDEEEGKNGDSLIRFYSPETVADMKIKLGEEKDQKVFRTTSISSGYCFTGYIALDDDRLVDVMKEAMEKPIILGNARTTGLGKCELLPGSLSVIDDPKDFPYASYMREADPEEGSAASASALHVDSCNDESDAVLDEGAITDAAEEEVRDCYMMLLSDTCMRNEYGEYCGIDIPTLEEALLGEQEADMKGKNLKVSFCSTSVTSKRGFNRHHGGAVPSVPMYEKGSVFHLTYRGRIDKEHLDALHQRGIGIRRNEGFGQVLFLRDYDRLKYKEKGEPEMLTAIVTSKDQNGDHGYKHEKKEEAAVIYQAAKAHYMNLIRSAMKKYIIENSLTGFSTSSQLGNILSIAMANQFQPEIAWENINAYFENKLFKEDKHRVQSADEGKKKKSVSLKVEVSKIESKELADLLEIKFKNSSERTIMGYPINRQEKDRIVNDKDKSDTDKSDTDKSDMDKSEKKELLSKEEELRAKLELLIGLIRYSFKEEVKA